METMYIINKYFVIIIRNLYSPLPGNKGNNKLQMEQHQHQAYLLGVSRATEWQVQGAF